MNFEPIFYWLFQLKPQIFLAHDTKTAKKFSKFLLKNLLHFIYKHIKRNRKTPTTYLDKYVVLKNNARM